MNNSISKHLIKVTTYACCSLILFSCEMFMEVEGVYENAENELYTLKLSDGIYYQYKRDSLFNINTYEIDDRCLMLVDWKDYEWGNPTITIVGYSDKKIIFNPDGSELNYYRINKETNRD